MGDASSPDPAAYTIPFQLTKTIHREKIPYTLSDSNPQNDQTGKIVVITGGGTGIGAVSTLAAFLQSLFVRLTSEHRPQPVSGSAQKQKAS